MSLIEKLQSKDPERNFLFTAIEQITKPDEMRQFYQEYVLWVSQNAEKEENRKNPEKVVNSNIGYCVGYYDQKTAERWFRALPSVSHPIFGREFPSWGQTKPVSEYVFVFKTEDEYIKKVILNNLREDLLYHGNRKSSNPLAEKLAKEFSEHGFKVVDNFFPTFDIATENDRNQDSKYTAAKLHVENRGDLGLDDSEIYILLCGYIEGLKMRLSEQFDSAPEIFIERIYNDKIRNKNGKHI